MILCVFFQSLRNEKQPFPKTSINQKSFAFYFEKAEFINIHYKIILKPKIWQFKHYRQSKTGSKLV